MEQHDDHHTLSPNETSGNNISYWLSAEEPIAFKPLEESLDTEILIVGGGIAGLTTAYLLLRSGKKVVVVEDGYIGSGESGRTTAQLTCALDNRYYALEDIFGKETAALAAQSHTAAIKKIETIVRTEHIDCEFRNIDGYLFLDPSDENENLLREFEATHSAGLHTMLLSYTPGIANGSDQSSIKFPGQAQFHIIKYLRGLCKAIIAMGGQIFTETAAVNITKKGAQANGYTIGAEQIVIATNSPVNDIVTMHTKQAAYRTYVIAAKIRKGKLPYALWWDSGNKNSRWVAKPYHYVRLEELDEEYDLLISGGEDHKTGQADEEHITEEDRYTNLELWTRTFFPDTEDILHYWSGQVLEPVDSLGFLGRNPGDENIYIITGDSGNGMTHATIGAMIITDLIDGVENPWTAVYDPSRITLHTIGDFLKEATNMAAQYADWFTSDHEKAENLTTGQGTVISSGLSKIALYRDDQNELHAFSAVCPHLGCVVQWNADEQSFDCPCHGSRFSHDGTVINGPAGKGLTKLEYKSS